MPRRSYLLRSAVSLIIWSISSVNVVPVSRVSGDVQPGSYVVVLKKITSVKTHVASMKGKFGASQATTKSHVTYDYDFMNGYSAELDDVDLKELTQSPDIEMIAPDTIAYPHATLLVQKDAPWGLSRILMEEPDGARHSSDILIGTAMVTEPMLRARSQVNNGGRQGRFCYCGQSSLGRRARENQRHYCRDQLAVAEARRKERPSVINMSLGDPANGAMDRAVVRAVAADVHVAVSAGNDNIDAGSTSPARVPLAITVGATNINDERWVWAEDLGSNFGKSVDILVPGEQITSAGKTNTGVTVEAGTSMAAPHVAGLIAYLLATEG
ncbi:hypothetical protein OPQ81_011485 [Rhizoctonia solani]|nr:hypothetical protein OPQ81_011485 [Rhizoctonia solani]